MELKNILNKKITKYITVLISLIVLFISILHIQEIKTYINNIKIFSSSMEAKTFDFRQVLLSKNKKVNNDIIIIGVDNLSQEYLTNYYGNWPMPRAVYADVIDYIQSYSPAAIGVDIMFVDPWKNAKEDDTRLAKTFAKYDNLSTVLYFDDYKPQERKPYQLPDNIKANIENESKNFNPFVSPNLRGILTNIVKNTQNIGNINLQRADDGVIRTLPLFWGYPEYVITNNNYKVKQIDYYPNFGLKILLKYLEKRDGTTVNSYKIDKNYNLIIGKQRIPMDNRGEAILSWYGTGSTNSTKTFNFIPFKDVFYSMNVLKHHQKSFLPKDTFKNKIVLIGFTADSLHDIKTVPTDKAFPALEIYSTFINNVLDNTIIVKNKLSYNIIITIFLCVIIGLFVLKINHTSISLLLSVALVFWYIWASIFVMKHYNLWIWLFIPIIMMLVTFISTYIIKYLKKSKDYDYTYKLATTDGLTNLYNHRYFQEQMLLQISNSERCKNKFSLILIDIDHFKKFNDNYGHLAGDTVLRQISDLIKKSARPLDMVFRYGGEEIAIILSNTDNESAITLAQRICAKVSEKPFKLSKDISKEVTISLGVSTYDDHGTTPVELIEYADKGLYKAKENGRNQVGK